MTDLEINAFKLLANCTFVPGIPAKRFVRQFHELREKEKHQLSENQKEWLWKLVWQYRKQHLNKWFTYYAKDRVAQDKPEPNLNWRD